VTKDYQSDFRLVTGNAKAFNSSETIYHSEAERIEAYGLEHISKAAATVIEYETDWNIEIEQDDENSALNADEYDGDAPPPMDVDGSLAAASPAPSANHGQPIRRGVRGPYKKAVVSSTIDNIDVEGRLPGSKDGLGAFPPGSDWAKLVLALKRKGKRDDWFKFRVLFMIGQASDIARKRRDFESKKKGRHVAQTEVSITVKVSTMRRDSFL
jgi:bromodomain-containing protein 7/9